MRPVSTALLLLLLATVSVGCGGTTDLTGSGGGDGGSREVSPRAADLAERLGQERLDDFGCGYGFTLGTPDQTVRVWLWSDNGFGEAPPAGTHELGEAWTGELVVGRDLFAQWCDDVMEPDEPEVVQEETWELTGTLTWELTEGDGECPSVATGTLTDGDVVTDEGDVTLPDLEFRNESFGCFAG